MIVFIDDTLVYSKGEDDHINYAGVVLQVLKKHQLFSKYIKCEFLLRSVALLGHIIYSEGVMFDPRKTEAIKN